MLTLFREISRLHVDTQSTVAGEFDITRLLPYGRNDGGGAGGLNVR